MINQSNRSAQMAATTDISPAARAANEAGRPSRSSPETSREDELAEQIKQLQTDLKSIAATLATLAEDKVNAAQSIAKREVKQLAKSGKHAVDEVQDEFGELEKQLKDTIREKPLTAVAGAIALGFLLAVVSR
jgi:ElaB/YqjD/DUF883 family membrane-anchored ribosome-binding protein